MVYLVVNQLKNKVMVDIIAFGAHPDDVELSAGGTLIKHVKNGFSVGIVDLTMGEMGTRGNITTRKMEAEKAKDIIGAKFRINLNLPDAFINISKDSISEIVKVIRTYKPQIVLCNAIKDRHPDHSVASDGVCFYSCLHYLRQPVSSSGHITCPSTCLHQNAVANGVCFNTSRQHCGQPLLSSGHLDTWRSRYVCTKRNPKSAAGTGQGRADERALRGAAVAARQPTAAAGAVRCVVRGGCAQF